RRSSNQPSHRPLLQRPLLQRPLLRLQLLRRPRLPTSQHPNPLFPQRYPVPRLNVPCLPRSQCRGWTGRFLVPSQPPCSRPLSRPRRRRQLMLPKSSPDTIQSCATFEPPTIPISAHAHPRRRLPPTAGTSNSIRRAASCPRLSTIWHCY